MLNRLLSSAEAAQVLGVHLNTLRRYVHEGTLNAVRVGKFIRFEEVVLQQWLNDNRVPVKGADLV